MERETGGSQAARFCILIRPQKPENLPLIGRVLIFFEKNFNSNKK